MPRRYVLEPSMLADARVAPLLEGGTSDDAEVEALTLALTLTLTLTLTLP